ncbi:MAG: winged helix-turn-helix transcriptional regulator [Thaumarchaeota archaeon]|nr:winged helix-turn-helix transcriptional regulator [Nitrososphaerota archaeon]
MLFNILAFGATIQGIVYNADTLEPANDAIVSINTTPIQRVIATNGEYSFQVPKGSYSIVARYFANGKLSSFTEENITILEDGNYSLDLLLFSFGDVFADDMPTFDYSVDELIAKEQQTNKNDELFPAALMAAITMILIIALIFYFSKKKPPAEKKDEKKEPPQQHSSEQEKTLDPDLRKIINLLRENEGRMTQLELRKHFPLSEGKVSLMISELEALGLIKKFKRGRGNIIKLT